jgi:hypothetical protein
MSSGLSVGQIYCGPNYFDQSALFSTPHRRGTNFEAVKKGEIISAGYLRKFNSHRNLINTVRIGDILAKAIEIPM